MIMKSRFPYVIRWEPIKFVDSFTKRLLICNFKSLFDRVVGKWARGIKPENFPLTCVCNSIVLRDIATISSLLSVDFPLGLELVDPSPCSLFEICSISMECQAGQKFKGEVHMFNVKCHIV
jgi:hypothetical protein